MEDSPYKVGDRIISHTIIGDGRGHITVGKEYEVIDVNNDLSNQKIQVINDHNDSWWVNHRGFSLEDTSCSNCIASCKADEPCPLWRYQNV
jgi:hypothetical protein